MATRTERQELTELRKTNQQLLAENKQLRAKINKPAAKTIRPSVREGSFWKSLGSILCICIAVALLFTGNLLFWAGNTIVKTDRYVEATAPIIKNAEVQKALAANINQKLFSSVDITQVTQDVLPPRADFLAPTIATQVQQHSQDTIEKILARPQFQERWNTAQARAHDRFIRLVSEHGSDGSIDLGEVYLDASQQLKGTKLAFLADKPLPAKAGSIELVSGPWLTALQKTIANIDTWRTIAIVLLVLVTALGVWLSRNRRRTVIILGSAFAIVLFLSLVSGRLTRELVAGRADPQYSEAIRQAYTILMHSLVVQTVTLMFASLLIAFIAWVSGESASSQALRLRINQLFSGKIHGTLFSRENSFTLWMGAHKKLLEWTTVVVIALAALFVRVTPAVLLTQVIIMLLIIVLIEILSARPAEESLT